MTIRLDEENIINYIKSFKKCQIRQTRHANSKIKNRDISFDDIIDALLMKTPIKIEQQESKKFLFVYNYTITHDLYIIVGIKDKFINIVTQYTNDEKLEE